MVKSSELISASEQSDIHNAIRAAESKTSAEIVPMIVRSSMGCGHVFPIVFLLMTVPVGFLIPIIPFDLFYPVPPWATTSLLVLISLILSFFLSKLDSVFRLVSSDRDEQIAVERRALAEFYNAQMSKTIAKTGILIFLSLRERRAVVLADESIASKFPPETWDQLLTELVSKESGHSIAARVSKAVKSCGDLVSKEFPRSANDKNEIPDKLIIKD
jgi:putative membrane protein